MPLKLKMYKGDLSGYQRFFLLHSYFYLAKLVHSIFSEKLITNTFFQKTKKVNEKNMKDVIYLLKTRAIIR